MCNVLTSLYAFSFFVTSAAFRMQRRHQQTARQQNIEISIMLPQRRGHHGRGMG